MRRFSIPGPEGMLSENLQEVPPEISKKLFYKLKMGGGRCIFYIAALFFD